MDRSVESQISAPLFLTGGGEMGELIRSMDWTRTPMGDFAGWPPALRTAVSLMLNTSFGMFITWGEDYIQLYNDAYRDILGAARHTQAMGSSVRHTLDGVWHIMAPIMEEVMNGKPVVYPNLLLPVDRYGYIEQRVFNLSCSPILLENAQAGGALAIITENTQNPYTLQEPEKTRKQLELAIDASELVIWNYYPFTNTFTASNRYEEWFGIPPKKKNFDLTLAIIAEKDRERVLKAMNKSLDPSSGGRFDIEYTIHPPLRKRRILRAKGRAWFNEQTSTYTLNGIMQEITDEVISHKSIIKSENNLRNIVLQAPVAMCVLKGKEYVVEIANEAMMVLWGTRAEEVIYKPIFEGRPEVKGQGLEHLLHQVYTTGEGFSAHERPMYLPRDGVIKLIYVNFIYAALREGDGTVSGILAVGTDVTDQVLVRKKIEESEQRFRTLAETLPQLIWVTDENGGQQYASSRWEEFAGIKPTGDDTWQQIVHPADMQKIAVAWNNSRTSGTVYTAEVRLKNKEGAYRWHSVQGEPILNDEGMIMKWIGAFTDIHDQKRITEKLESLVNERTAELQRSNDDLQQFAHVASHDLKEPLRKIKTFTNRLEEDRDTSLSEKSKTYLEKIQNASDRLFSMIDGVLKYSMVDAHQQPIETVDLKMTIESIENDLELIIQKQGATFQYDKLSQVEGSSVLLYQLFYNLINNSLKFARPDEQQKIFIETVCLERTDKVFIEICIRDNGIGFDQEQSEKIFNTFTRLNSKDKFEGTGLGLALCKKIVQRHHGTITARGNKNIGAEFIITLPQKQITNHI